MQIEADDERQPAADHLAHPAQDLAFAIVEMLAHHGAMQVEIDRIKRPGAFDTVDNHLDNTLIGVFCYMGAGAGGSENRRHQFPGVHLGFTDEAGKADVDVANRFEDISALRIAGQPPPWTKSA